MENHLANLRILWWFDSMRFINSNTFKCTAKYSNHNETLLCMLFKTQNIYTRIRRCCLYMSTYAACVMISSVARAFNFETILLQPPQCMCIHGVYECILFCMSTHKNMDEKKRHTHTVFLFLSSILHKNIILRT